MANGYGISFQGDENVLELVVHKVVNIPQIADEFYYMWNYISMEMFFCLFRFWFSFNGIEIITMVQEAEILWAKSQR